MLLIATELFLDAVVINRKPQDTEVLLSETAFLGCDVSYNPRYEIVYEWLFNGVPIDLNNHPYYGLVSSIYGYVNTFVFLLLWA